MSMLFSYGKGLEWKAEEVMQKGEDLVNLSFNASGSSFMGVMSQLDGESGAMIGGVMDMYKTAKEFAMMQAQAMDRLLEDFEELKNMNKDLCKQNEEMQRLLRDLNREVKKTGDKD